MEQAGIQTTDYGSGEFFDKDDIHLDQFEKFAKLLIKECISKVEMNASQYCAPVWAYEIVNDIKEQFGVEE